MPALRKHRAGVLESEFIVTGSELILAFELRAGKVTRSVALARLQDWRWTPADADKFLDLIEEAGALA